MTTAISHPLPYGSQIKKITKGKNKGKYAVYGLYYVKNSLKRFANTPLYMIRNMSSSRRDFDTYPCIMKNASRLFDAKDKAEKYVSRYGGKIEVLTLTVDQIAY